MDVLSGRKNHKIFTANPLNIFSGKMEVEKRKDRELCKRCQVLRLHQLRRLQVWKELFFFMSKTHYKAPEFTKTYGIPLINMLHKCAFLGL
jgi:hypothetical protein